MAVKSWEIDRETRRRAFSDGPIVRVLIGSEAGLRTGLVEVTVPPGGMMPEHDHGASEVLLSVLGGEARLVEVADATVTALSPGAVVTIPVGERVRVENPGSEDARLLVALTPPDFADALAAWPPVAEDA
ncbi:MAG: cupin domain-containing protein [Solirubrobacteraceae bacterium]